MNVTLTRRWGPYREGRSVDVNDSQAEWLIRHNYAESSGTVTAPEQEPAAEGAHGADPLAGGDATRRRPTVTHAERGDDENRAQLAEGAPPAAHRAGYDDDTREREGRQTRSSRSGSRGKATPKPKDEPGGREAKTGDTQSQS